MLMSFIEQTHSFISLDARYTIVVRSRVAWLHRRVRRYQQQDQHGPMTTYRPSAERMRSVPASQPAQMTFLTQCLRTVALRQVQQSPTHTNYLPTDALPLGQRSARLLQQKSIPSRLRDSRPSETNWTDDQQWTTKDWYKTTKNLSTIPRNEGIA